MDLLVLNHRDPRHPQAGGSEVVLWEVFRRLSGLGVEVTWLAERFPRSREDETFGSIFIRRRGDPLSLHFFSLVEARRHEFVLDSVAHAVPFFSYLVNPRSVALVHHVHQDVLDLELGRGKAFVLKKLERTLSRYPLLIAVSHTTKRELVERFCVPGERIRVIHNGLDHNFYRPHFERKNKTPTILWLGRLKRYKNPLDAPRIFSLLPSTLRSNAKLVVAGRGDLERETREAVEKVGGVFLGGVSEEEKLRLYQSAWVVLSTSFIEGWGMTIVEANACGTPVVGYATGSIPEIIRDGVNGFTVPYKDLRAAAKRVEQILTMDSWEREALWKASHEESLKYDWDKTAAEYYGVLRSLF